MQHFTCDFCGKDLDERRFVAKLELFPAYDLNKLTETDLDIDHLQSIADQIEEAELFDFPYEDEEQSITLQFDLCPQCHLRYRRDPLGKLHRPHTAFSDN